MDYRQYIGQSVRIKTTSCRFPILGILKHVYSDVLIVQGITCWGVDTKEIVKFTVEQPGLFDNERGIVTPLEGATGNTTAVPGVRE